MFADNYPETMHSCYFVNTPMAFTIVWSIIKGWIDEKTRNKMKFLGANFKNELLEVIDAHQLPKFLGGTCECPGGCTNSDRGPWKDFEPVYPFGFRKKADLNRTFDTGATHYVTSISDRKQKQRVPKTEKRRKAIHFFMEPEEDWASFCEEKKTSLPEEDFKNTFIVERSDPLRPLRSLTFKSLPK